MQRNLPRREDLAKVTGELADAAANLWADEVPADLVAAAESRVRPTTEHRVRLLLRALQDAGPLMQGCKVTPQALQEGVRRRSLLRRMRQVARTVLTDATAMEFIVSAAFLRYKQRVDRSILLAGKDQSPEDLRRLLEDTAELTGLLEEQLAARVQAQKATLQRKAEIEAQVAEARAELRLMQALHKLREDGRADERELDEAIGLYDQLIGDNDPDDERRQQGR